MQITQATITPICRNKGDIEALDEALHEIRYKTLMAMGAKPYNNNSTFKITATLIREEDKPEKCKHERVSNDIVGWRCLDCGKESG